MDILQQESQQRTARRNEIEMLDLIVEAMLESKAELRDASVAQWSEILTDSCRHQRVAAGPQVARPHHVAA